MNKNQRNRNKTKKKTRRSISRAPDNSNSLAEILNQEKIKEQKNDNNMNNLYKK